MIPTIKRLALALGLTLALGFTLIPQGCGGITPAADVPEGVARLLRGCALDHRKHLGSAAHSVSFDVNFDSDGQVDSVALRESTLGDEVLELCMASALRSLSEDDLPMRRSEKGPYGPVTPESRTLVGQPQAAAVCLVSPPCLLMLGFLMGATFITVQFYVHASSTPRPPPARPHVEASQKKDPKPEGDPKSTGTSPPIPPPPPKEQKETCAEKMPDLIRCDDSKISRYDFRSEDAAFRSIKIKGIRKEESKKNAERGPCKNRGGWHTRVKVGKGYIASIVGCDCCDDSSGKAIAKERAGIEYH